MTEKTLAQQQAEGLRALADMIEQNPELAEELRYSAMEGVNIPILHNAASTIAAFARAGVAHNAQIEEHSNEKHAGTYLRWGPVGIHVYARRELLAKEAS
ncbi:hypothetical protein [Amycolatopsis palatopharyngis]|uniref:hypothetical protein n=1 Tax=Amycolatopsis palatopharyngis TaxID=187982 RepID=UPI000E273395|nr:hypothetical protein [Amycolatopsis palatopharyngis]